MQQSERYITSVQAHLDIDEVNNEGGIPRFSAHQSIAQRDKIISYHIIGSRLPFTRMLCSMVLFTLVGMLVIATAAKEARTECIDSQMTATLEYHYLPKYKSIQRGESKTFACHMITQCSVDRLYRLAKQVKAWQGMTSAAVYVPVLSRAEKKKHLASIDKFMIDLSKDPQYTGRLTVSVLFGHEDTPKLWNCADVNSPGVPLYPINALRNLAAAGSGHNSANDSPYMFYLDADFVPSTGLSDWIDHQSSIEQGQSAFHKLLQNGSLVVVPAFESDAPAPITPTRSLDYLLDGIRNETVRQFHLKRFSKGHAMTNYTKWQELTTVPIADPMTHPWHPYPVTYQGSAEPYVIMARATFVPFDERFRGYGYNKCANLRWHEDDKRPFYVLPGHFVVEDAHVKSAIDKKAAKNTAYLQQAYQDSHRGHMDGRMPLISHNTALLLRATGFARVATEDPAAHEEYLRTVAKPV